MSELDSFREEVDRDKFRRMKFQALFAVGCVVLSMACSPLDRREHASVYVNEENAVTVEVENYPYDPVRFLGMEKYADSVKFVRLESNAENLITSINELFFTDDWIIVVDARAGNIFFFDHSGNYSHKIHRRGRGPGEYLTVSNVMIDEKKASVMVYDIQPRRLLSYTFTGDHISTIDNFSDGSLVRDLINLPTGEFLCCRLDGTNESNEGRSGLWKVAPNGEFETFLYRIDDEYPFVFSENWFYLYRLPNDRIGFVDRNRIFSTAGDTLYKRVEFNMPDKTVADFKGVLKTDEKYVMMMNNQEKGGYIFTEWSDANNGGFMTVYSKSDQRTDVGVVFYPALNEQYVPGIRNVRNNTENILSSWFMPSFIRPSNVSEEFRDSAKKLLSGISEDQIEDANPILQLLYIKDR